MSGDGMSQILVCKKCGTIWDVNANKDKKCAKCGSTETRWAKCQNTGDPQKPKLLVREKPMLPL